MVFAFEDLDDDPTARVVTGCFRGGSEDEPGGSAMSFLSQASMSNPLPLNEYKTQELLLRASSVIRCRTHGHRPSPASARDGFPPRFGAACGYL
jgi:hypothetical protein